MIVCISSSSLPNLRSPPTSSNQTTPEPHSEPQPGKLKTRGSPQLNRWSRARAIRSGRKLDRPGHRATQAVVEGNSPVHLQLNESASLDPENISDGHHVVEAAKSIYMVSDGTGWTAEHSVNAALGQFEHCLVDRGCAVNTHLFSGV